MQDLNFTILPPLCFEYKNYKSIVSRRNVQPIKIWYGETKYHPIKQYFLKAYDLDKDQERDFALSDIKEFY